MLVDDGAAIVDPESGSSIERISQPTTMLWCPRGILDQSPGLYEPSYLESVAAALDHVTLTEVPDTNHYTVVTADHGAGSRRRRDPGGRPTGVTRAEKDL